jgi:hypothetical protein
VCWYLHTFEIDGASPRRRPPHERSSILP